MWFINGIIAVTFIAAQRPAVKQQRVQPRMYQRLHQNKSISTICCCTSIAHCSMLYAKPLSVLSCHLSSVLCFGCSWCCAPSTVHAQRSLPSRCQRSFLKATTSLLAVVWCRRVCCSRYVAACQPQQGGPTAEQSHTSTAHHPLACTHNRLQML